MQGGERWRPAPRSGLRSCRRRWDLNPRMEGLQTSPLGLLGTGPDATSITKRRANCQLPAGRTNLDNFGFANLYCCRQLRDEFPRLILTVKEPPGLLG